ncbi:MAG: extracellular solute-binding protein [Rubrobacteraceae bacterium]
MAARRLDRREFLKLSAAASGAVLAGGALSACGGNGQTSSGKPGSLNMLYATAEANSEAVQSVLPDFEKEFGVEINFETNPYDALQQKVFAELASSSPFYDILIVDTPWMPALTTRIEPLTSYVNDPKLNDVADPNLKDFIPKVFYDTSVYHPSESYRQFPGETGEVDVPAIEDEGFEVFGFPLQANVLVVSYRQDLFEDPDEQRAFEQRHGKPLRFPETWEEFVPVAEFFTRPEERLYGTTLMAGAGDWATDDFKTLLECWGGNGRMISDDFGMAFQSQEGIDALSYYAGLIDRKVTPPGVTSFSWDTVGSTFGQGLAAIGMNYNNMTLGDDIEGKVGYAMVPKKEKYGPHFGTWMLSVNKFSRNKEWAYRAITWLTSAETQTKMLQAQLHPSRTSVYESTRSDESLAEEFGNYYDVLGDSLEVGVGRPRLINYSDVTEAIGVAVNNAATGRQAPEEALGQAASTIASSLELAGYPVG